MCLHKKDIQMHINLPTTYVIMLVAGVILCMHPANKRRRYYVMSSVIGWAHTQNDPCGIGAVDVLPCYVMGNNADYVLCNSQSIVVLAEWPVLAGRYGDMSGQIMVWEY